MEIENRVSCFQNTNEEQNVEEKKIIQINNNKKWYVLPSIEEQNHSTINNLSSFYQYLYTLVLFFNMYCVVSFFNTIKI